MTTTSTDSPRTGKRLATLYGWAVFVVVVLVATYLVGALALMVASVVTGVALIVTGIRSHGWPRPVLIVVGALLVALPILLFIDMATGYFVVTVQ